LEGSTLPKPGGGGGRRTGDGGGGGRPERRRLWGSGGLGGRLYEGGEARRGEAGRKVGRRDGGQSGVGMADSGVDCRDRRDHTCVVSPTRVALHDELFATASVAAATVWTAAAAAVKHEHATKNYRRVFIELITGIVRCSKNFLENISILKHS